MAGQELFRTITPAYYRGAMCVLIVYDITDPATFDHIDYWMQQIKKHGDEQALVVLTGNKLDLLERRKVPFEDGRAWAEKYHVPFFECSAKSGETVEQVFVKLLELVVNQRYRNSLPTAQIDLHDSKQHDRRSKSFSCCRFGPRLRRTPGLGNSQSEPRALEGTSPSVERQQELERFTSLRLGVHINYLVHRLRTDVQNAVGTSRVCFYDLKDSFWLKLKSCENAPDFLGSQSKYCPRDGRRGCSIVDAMAHSWKGSATHYLSWTWGITLDEFSSALKGWHQKCSNVSHVCVWVCFFCNNQHRIIVEGSEAGSDSLEDQFYSRLNQTSAMLILMDGFRQPSYVSRIWCVYELFIGVAKKMPAHVILPEACAQQLVDDLNSSGGLSRVQACLNSLDVESATAYDPKDVERIKKQIVDSVGYEAVNQAAKSYLKKWLVDEFNKLLTGAQETMPIESAAGGCFEGCFEGCFGDLCRPVSRTQFRPDS